MKRLSIVVPMYNVESYIERCLLSLVDQDIPLDEYEIICIDDGSSDNTGHKVNELKSKYHNIVLVNQENQGVSVARNKGMDVARGQYVMMIDADDYIKPCILKVRLDVMDKYNLDVGLTGYTLLDAKGEEDYTFDPPYEQSDILSGIDYEKKYLLSHSEPREQHTSVAIFLKISFLNQNNLRYLSGVPYLEDAELTRRIICLAKRITFINEPFYLRTIRPGSATQSNLFYTKKAIDGFLKSAVNLSQFKIKQCISEEQKVFMNQSIVHFTILYILAHGILPALKNVSQIKSKLKQAELGRLDPTGCSTTYRRMAKFYNCSVYCLLVLLFTNNLLQFLSQKFRRFDIFNNQNTIN